MKLIFIGLTFNLLIMLTYACDPILESTWSDSHNIFVLTSCDPNLGNLDSYNCTLVNSKFNSQINKELKYKCGLVPVSNYSTNLTSGIPLRHHTFLYTQNNENNEIIACINSTLNPVSCPDQFKVNLQVNITFVVLISLLIVGLGIYFGCRKRCRRWFVEHLEWFSCCCIKAQRTYLEV